METIEFLLFYLLLILAFSSPALIISLVLLLFKKYNTARKVSIYGVGFAVSGVTSVAAKQSPGIAIIVVFLAAVFFLSKRFRNKINKSTNTYTSAKNKANEIIKIVEENIVEKFINCPSSKYFIADIYTAVLYYIEYRASNGSFKFKRETKIYISDIRKAFFEFIKENHQIDKKNLTSVYSDRFNFYKSMPKDQALEYKLSEALTLLLVDLYGIPKDKSQEISVEFQNCIKIIKQQAEYPQI